MLKLWRFKVSSLGQRCFRNICMYLMKTCTKKLLIWRNYLLIICNSFFILSSILEIYKISFGNVTISLRLTLLLEENRYLFRNVLIMKKETMQKYIQKVKQQFFFICINDSYWSFDVSIIRQVINHDEDVSILLLLYISL